jgi:hypothetical protein
MDFFDVEKGEDDIRVVFNGTSSGLNDVLSAPWFFLPTMSTMTRTVDVNYWMGDNDFGEIFYIFLAPQRSTIAEWRGCDKIVP